MPTIITKADNVYLKRVDKSLAELEPSQYRKIAKAGTALKVSTIYPAKNQNLIVTISGNSTTFDLKDKEEWIAYQPHFETQGGLLRKGSSIAPKNIRLDVPYFAQCDTREDGYRFCNSHSNAALAAYLLGDEYFDRAKKYAQPEQFYIENLLRYGDTTDSDAQTRCLREVFAIESYWSYTLSPKDVYASLEAKIPIVCGLAYKSSGHIVCIVGMEYGDYLLHDPYGIRNGISNSYYCNSTDQGKEGAYDKYTAAAMDAVFWDQGGSDRESGWGRIVTSVKGKPTGLKTGL